MQRYRKSFVRVILVWLSLALNVIGVTCCCILICSHYRARNCLQEIVRLDGVESSGVPVYMRGAVRINEGRHVSEEFLYQQMYATNGKYLVLSRSCDSQIDRKRGVRTIRLLSENICASWRYDMFGVCSNVVLYYNSAPILFDDGGKHSSGLVRRDRTPIIADRIHKIKQLLGESDETHQR